MTNAAEVEGLVSAGRKDAAAIVSYFAWLEAQLAGCATVTEAGGADELARRRAAMPGAVGNSFPTISSTGANAAIIHYQAAHGACSDIAPGAVYLSQSLAFRRPVHLGDAVTAEVSVERVGRAGRLLDFATRCTNEQGELVLDGSARCLLPAAGEPG